MKQFRMSSAFNLHSCSRENVSQYIRTGLEFYKEAGFDAIDFGTTILSIDSDEWRAQAEQALKDCEEVGIRFEMGHLPFVGGGAKSEDFLQAFNAKMHNAIDAAAYLGLEYAVMHPNRPGIPAKKYDEKAEFETVMSQLAPYVEHANRVGLKVVVENMRTPVSPMQVRRYCQNADELCFLADSLGIGICWDFGHANISGLKQSEALEKVGKRLKVIHVNDNGGIEDDHILPFTGNVDWKDAMHGLALAGYEGLFNFELAATRAPAGMRKAYAAYVLEAGRELTSYIL